MHSTNHHLKRTDYRLRVRSFVVGVHHLRTDGRCHRGRCYLEVAQDLKTISKWKISTARNRGFEAEIGDLYTGENGVATKYRDITIKSDKNDCVNIDPGFICLPNFQK